VNPKPYTPNPEPLTPKPETLKSETYFHGALPQTINPVPTLPSPLSLEAFTVNLEGGTERRQLHHRDHQVRRTAVQRGRRQGLDTTAKPQIPKS